MDGPQHCGFYWEIKFPQNQLFMQEKTNFAQSIQVSFGKTKTKYFLRYMGLTQIKRFSLFFN